MLLRAPNFLRRKREDGTMCIHPTSKCAPKLMHTCHRDYLEISPWITSLKIFERPLSVGAETCIIFSCMYPSTAVILGNLQRLSTLTSSISPNAPHRKMTLAACIRGPGYEHMYAPKIPRVKTACPIRNRAAETIFPTSSGL